uniref:Uncharacterized protein n=1 Tax=Glossina pallidipes TaxID=7398 RepID=A0A1A9ZJT8_GLOPL
MYHEYPPAKDLDLYLEILLGMRPWIEYSKYLPSMNWRAGYQLFKNSNPFCMTMSPSSSLEASSEFSSLLCSHGINSSSPEVVAGSDFRKSKILQLWCIKFGLSSLSHKSSLQTI